MSNSQNVYAFLRNSFTIKGSNILVQEGRSDPTMPTTTTIITRLIDWGLSIYKKDTIKKIVKDGVEYYVPNMEIITKSE